MNGFSSDATELPTSPVSEELREKVTPLLANAAMRIAASFSEAEAGAPHDIARVAVGARAVDYSRARGSMQSGDAPSSATSERLSGTTACVFLGEVGHPQWAKWGCP